MAMSGQQPGQPHALRNNILELFNELDLRSEARERQREEMFYRRLNQCLAASQEGKITSLPAPPPPWPQSGPTPTIQAQQFVEPSTLLDWIAIPDLLAEDLQFITARRKTRVPGREQARAEHLIRTRQIREWITAPNSTQLLIHGNFDRRAYISGLSLFCMSLAETLTERAPRYITLTFFCGLHADPFGSQAHTGGRALMQSFIRQLLEQHDFSRSHIFASDIDEDLLRDGNVAELCKLFETLVHALPASVVLFCLLDGIVYYERESFKDDMALVLIKILEISDDINIHLPVKVLITSPTKTSEVRQAFPHDLILTMEAMAYSGTAASSSRLRRELNNRLG